VESLPRPNSKRGSLDYVSDDAKVSIDIRSDDWKRRSCVKTIK